LIYKVKFFFKFPVNHQNVRLTAGLSGLDFRPRGRLPVTIRPLDPSYHESEFRMYSKFNRALRWFTLLASGMVLFQATAGCIPTLEVVQTGLLAGITGILIFLAQNV